MDGRPHTDILVRSLYPRAGYDHKGCSMLLIPNLGYLNLSGQTESQYAVSIIVGGTSLQHGAEGCSLVFIFFPEVA